MKKIAIIFGLSMAMTVTLANAQIKVTSSNVQIGNGLDVGTSEIAVHHPVQIGMYTLQEEGTQDVTFGMGKYGLQFGLSGVRVQPTATGLENGGGISIGGVDAPAAYLRPLGNCGADLGLSGTWFRRLYVQQVTELGSKTISDARCKENVKELSDVMAKLLLLRPVSFDFKPDSLMPDTTGLKGKVGFLAQEVKEVLPGLVGYMEEIDRYTMDYQSMIPYLVKALQGEYAEKEAMKEELEAMRQEIEVLQEMVETMLQVQGLSGNVKSPRNQQVKNEDAMDDALMRCKLYQSVPNPFSETTVIRYELPQNAGNASICVFDMQGKRVMERALPQGVEAGQIEISGNTLKPGMYTYSLLVSGNAMDSKKMVVME